MKTSSQNYYKLAQIITFISRFLPLLAAVCLVFFLLMELQSNSITRNFSIIESGRIQGEKNILENSINRCISDTVFLSILAAQHETEGDESEKVLDDLAREFRSFSASRTIYDQVRFLDKEGQEVIRIDQREGRFIIRAKEELQYKGDRYYYENGMKTEKSVYISRFDLNKEKGKVEEPHKPMIRLTAKVWDAAGNIDGLIVLNFLGERILQRLQQVTKETGTSYYLLNSDGFWLTGPDPDRNWGFMFPQGGDWRFSHDFQGEWPSISESLQGQFLTENGLFTYVSIFAGDSDSVESDERWILLSLIPSENLIPPYRSHFYMLCLLLIILLGGALWFWTGAREKRKMAESRLRDYQNQLEQTVLERTGELESLNQTLIESEEKFKAISSAVPVAIIMFDQEERIHFWNRAAEKIFHRMQSELDAEQVLKQLFTEDSSRKLQGLLAENKSEVTELNNITMELTAVTAEKIELPVEISLANVKIKSALNYLLIVRDISIQKKAKAEMLKSMEDFKLFSRLAIEREEKMIELKKEINTLYHNAGKKERYKIV